MRLAAVLVFAIPVVAQLDRATLNGTVTDPTGAAVPAVKIAIQQTATGARFETTTKEAGQFTRPNLPVGEYQITFEANGFRRATRSGLSLQVAEVLRVDTPLELGATADALDVRRKLPRLQADTPQIGTSLGAKALANLPLSISGGRQTENFSYAIVPGVSGDTFRGRINSGWRFGDQPRRQLLPDGRLSGSATGSEVPDRWQVGRAWPHLGRRV